MKSSDQDRAPRTPRSEPSFSTGGVQTRAKILIVDDDALIGGVVKRTLGLEHDVTYVASGDAALHRIFDGERFDVILCDMMMPIMSGIEFYAELSRKAGDQADRVAFLTGGAFTPIVARFLETVARPRLEKPFDVDALTEFVRARLA